MKNLKKISQIFVVAIFVLAACKKKDPEPSFTFTSVSVLEGNVNDEITLSGSDMSTDAVIKFGDVEATEKSGGGASLKVKVPNGSAKGKISINKGGKTITSKQDFTTKNYVQRVKNVQNVADDYDIPLLYKNNKAWFKREMKIDGGTRTGPNSFSELAYVSWENAKTICPEGWRLPTIDENNNLVGYTDKEDAQKSYEFLTSESYQLGFNGFVNLNTNTISEVGNFGYLWTSTEKNADAAYVLLIGKTSNPRYYHAESRKEIGVCVRCVKDL